MAAFPDRAQVVVIGAGIVGNSVVHHLARLGWRDILLLDKGPLPDPGGSTGHASNFVFPVDHSREITLLTADSMRQYTELGTSTTCGGIELARTPERVQELHRRMSSARAWGIESDLVTPAQVAADVPFLDPGVVLAGFRTPSVAVVDPLRAGELMRQRATEAGALTVAALTEVLAIDTEDGRVRRVRTDRGDVDTEYVVVACGVWSPRIARLAGATIPLTPAVHQMIDVGPIAELAATGREIAYPIIRDMDPLMYERQSGPDLEIGSYAHRPILYDPDDIPSSAAAALSPTQLPFTPDDFDPQMEAALELFAGILDRPDAGIRHAINGLLSLTPDGHPLLGETPEVRGLWSAAAVWIKEGPGVGRLIAEWMTDGAPEIDPAAADIARFAPHERTRAHVRARAAEGFNKTYGIVHPREQWSSDRGARRSPFHERERALGAEFFEVAGWERPQWYAANAPLVAEFGVEEPPARVGRALVVPDHRRRAPGDAPGRRDDRPQRVHPVRRARPRRARLPPAPDGRADGPARRSGDLHARPGSRRRVPQRPDRRASRCVALPGGHRRCRRGPRPRVVPAPPPRRRVGRAHRPHLRGVHARAVGPAGAGRPGRGHRGATSPTPPSGSRPRGS